MVASPRAGNGIPDATSPPWEPAAEPRLLGEDVPGGPQGDVHPTPRRDDVKAVRGVARGQHDGPFVARFRRRRRRVHRARFGLFGKATHAELHSPVATAAAWVRITRVGSRRHREALAQNVSQDAAQVFVRLARRRVRRERLRDVIR